MRITNVEKFRKDLYEAIKDTLEWSIEMPSAIFKSGIEYKDTMTEYTHYETIDGALRVISLPHPIAIGNDELYLTVGTDAINFWKSENGYFTYDGYIEFELYRNKFSFIAALVLRIANKIEK